MGGQSRQRPATNTRRKRWIATASCVALVAAAAGAGYWSNYVYLSDLTALDAWNRYMDLVKDGKYDEAQRYFPEQAPLFDGEDSRDFLTDAAHAHAPSKVTFEGRAVPNNSTENEGIRTEIEGTVRFNASRSDAHYFNMHFDETTRRNGQLGMWKINASSYGSMTTLIDTEGLRSIRIGDILVSNPQGSYLLLPGSYRMEATPKNPDYWTINYEHPLADGAGEIRTNIVTKPFTIEANDTLKEWVREQSEAFATSCRTGTPDASREDACGALALSTTPFDPTQDYLSVHLVETTSFLLTVSTGETAPTDDKHTHYNARFKCTIDFAYDGATPTTECTLDK